MTTPDPFTVSVRTDAPFRPPHVTYAAHRLDGGYFAQCDGCGWCGDVVATETEAWEAAIEHMVTNRGASA